MSQTMDDKNHAEHVQTETVLNSFNRKEAILKFENEAVIDKS